MLFLLWREGCLIDPQIDRINQTRSESVLISFSFIEHIMHAERWWSRCAAECVFYWLHLDRMYDLGLSESNEKKTASFCFWIVSLVFWTHAKHTTFSQNLFIEKLWIYQSQASGPAHQRCQNQLNQWTSSAHQDDQQLEGTRRRSTIRVYDSHMGLT